MRFKIGALFVGVTIALLLVAAIAGSVLVQSKLVGEAQRYQRESGLRLLQALESSLEQTRVLAATLAEVAGNGDPRAWTPRVAPLVAASGLEELVAAVGWWPEPVGASASRTSRFWLADGVGSLIPRDDYNDPRAIPYWREPWYTPARYAEPGACYWSLLHTEPLVRRGVVGCTLAMRDARGFSGAVTVLLDATGLDRLLARAAAGQSGYALLVDRDNRLIAATGPAAQALARERPRNLAELAQRMPPFNTLALELHQRDERFLSRAVQSPAYDAEAIKQLKDGTRDYSRQEAESALALLWNVAAGRPAVSAEQSGTLRELRIGNDAILAQRSVATVFELPQSYWKLVRVVPAREGMAGAQLFFLQLLGLVMAALILAMILVFFGLRTWLLRPLARMAGRLADARTLEESLHVQLEAGASNELGVIGHWYNERVRQLRESMERVMSQQSQLVIEAGERTRADEQSLRLRERAGAVLTSMSDAVIVLDVRGAVEDMNGPAERLCGVVLRNVRGRPCGEVLRLHLANQGGTPPDFAASIVASSGRVEHGDGLFLQVDGRAEREIQLVGSPLRGPGGRNLGAVLVFRPREAPVAAPKLVIDRRSVDPVTGLPTRAACDRRLRALCDSARLSNSTHGLFVCDVDRLGRVNDSLGMRAGDEVLLRVAETLVQSVPKAEVFRLGADSFAAVIEGATAEQALEAAQGVCDALEHTPLRWGEQSIEVTASFGALGFDGTPDHPIDLLRRAQEACEAAKAAGRNTVRAYDAAMGRRSPVADEAAWHRRIRAGLEEGLLHLTTQAVHPAEAHAAEGAVFDVSFALEDEEGFWAEPAGFLPFAERAGLVADVERWALRQAFEHLARNPDVVGRIAFCSLQLSAATVSEGATLELLAQLLQSHPQVPSKRLCLVLRAGVLEDAPGSAQTFVDAAHALGCRVAIEHAGVGGASALEQIRRIRADFLRVDARQWPGVAEDAVEQVVGDSILRLARSLQSRVIVTDIADDALRAAWSRAGADYFQGPAVARPSPTVFSAPG